MPRHVAAIVNGFTKNATILECALAPLRTLKRRGHIDRILYVTWDTPDIDAFVAPVAAMDDIELVRVPQPNVTGTPNQRGVMYQTASLAAGLERVVDKDALIVKVRPDFIADENFLESKIEDFDALCGPSDSSHAGVKMPPSPFKAKIWVPWADSNMPFFAEDGAFIGLKRDVAKLTNPDIVRHLEVLTLPECGWFAHVARFAPAFLPAYPMFKRYLREFHLFANDMAYRQVQLPAMMECAFYWHMLVAHAWILATSFHVDCGRKGDLTLYTNTSNANADWSNVAGLSVNAPYDFVQDWRDGEKPGGMMPCTARVYGRLVDDDWQLAMFAGPLRDLSEQNVREMLRNVAMYRSGILDGEEDAFYARLAKVHSEHWRARAA